MTHPTAHSLSDLSPNTDWASLPLFDRTGWKRVAFADFAENVNERVEPADAADDVYVGLDDIDPKSLHIRRWGKGSDVTGTKLRFRNGDIIFGRRRAYQRKLAVARMSGICSAHAMVVRAKPKMILPEFLPFLMMSDRFMNRAVEISVGSLSPTINWTTLKREEFDLPPLEQQRRIADLLWTLDRSFESFAATIRSARTALDSESRVMFSDDGPQCWPMLTASDFCRVQQGQVDPKESPYSGMIHIAPDDIESETGRILELKTAAEDNVISGKYEFNETAVLYSKIRPNLRKVAFPGFAGVCSADVYPVYAQDNILSGFLFHLLLSEHFTKFALMHSARSAFPKLNREALFSYRCRIPSLDEQRMFLDRVGCIASIVDRLASHTDSLSRLNLAISALFFS